MDLKKYNVLLFSLLFSLFASADQSWVLSKEQSGVTVYLKDLDKKNLKAFKATVEIKADKDTIFEFFKDFPSYCDWFADCVEARVIKHFNDNENIGYFVNKTPWPVEDRDATFHRYLSRTEDSGFKLRFIAESGHLASQPCCIRIMDAEGSLLVEDTDRIDTSLVTYQFYSDPAGEVPNWLVNTMIIDSPITTLTNLKRLVERSAR